MKKNLLLIGIAVTGITACHTGTEKLKAFIPGTYVHQGQSEFSVANDTLEISEAPNTENIYFIARKTGYRRIQNGKLLPQQHQVKHWTGQWDEQKHILQVMQTGNFLIFQPEKKNLLNGTSEYWKL